MNIYLSSHPSLVEQNAASELSEWLQKACQTEFPILTEPEDNTDALGIYIGYTAFADRNRVQAMGGRNALGGVEAWVIRAVGESLVLTGGKKNTDRGILYAVEHCLEDVIGIRFWNALEEYVPTINNFSIDPSLDLSGEPELEMRRAVSCNYIGDDKMLALRRRQNDALFSDAWGGGVTCSSRGSCHTIHRILPKSEEQFREHPDWYAWNDKLNKRLPYGHYCLNNEEFLQAFEKAFIDDIARLYAEADEKGEARPHHFHISLEDTSHICQCPKCKEAIAKSGQTGNVLRFVNRMAEAADKVYPGVLVETLAYWQYMELPLDDTVPAKNVIVRLADIGIDILHSLSHPNNKHELEVLKGWADICKKGGNPLAIWDYNVCYTQTPVSNLYRLAENFRIYADHGVVGQFIENEQCLISDFWCLKNWLLTHLMEDPYADDRALIADFTEKYYGAAAPYLTKWIELTEEISAKSNLRMRCVQFFTKADHITYDAVLEGNRLFDEAEAAVLYDEVLTRRVRQARATLDVAIFERYDTLLYVAKRRGETLPFAKETAGLRYALTLQQTADLAKKRYLEQYPDADPATVAKVASWEGRKVLPWQQFPHKSAPLPEQLAGTDALAIPLHDHVFIGNNVSNTVYVKDPDAAIGLAMRMPLETATPAQQDLCKMYSKDDTDHPHFAFSLRHRGKNLRHKFYLDEIVPDRYALYHLFDIDDLEEDSITLLRGIVFKSVPLSPFVKDLQTGKVSVWISVKFAGAAYGGSSEIPDSISVDRMFLVPRA
jgi:hypothetical protein